MHIRATHGTVVCRVHIDTDACMDTRAIVCRSHIDTDAFMDTRAIVCRSHIDTDAFMDTRAIVFRIRHTHKKHTWTWIHIQEIYICVDMCARACI
jgi:hypothetical protein